MLCSPIESFVIVGAAGAEIDVVAESMFEYGPFPVPL